MDQLLDPEFGMLPAGPRHARPVTFWSRVAWALDKGPANWTWKTNTIAVLMVIGVLVGLGVAAAIITMVGLFITH